jgi:hypothetical protein
VGYCAVYRGRVAVAPAGSFCFEVEGNQNKRKACCMRDGVGCCVQATAVMLGGLNGR